jgi:hypothetical protein
MKKSIKPLQCFWITTNYAKMSYYGTYFSTYYNFRKANEHNGLSLALESLFPKGVLSKEELQSFLNEVNHFCGVYLRAIRINVNINIVYTRLLFDIPVTVHFSKTSEIEGF